MNFIKSAILGLSNLVWPVTIYIHKIWHKYLHSQLRYGRRTKSEAPWTLPKVGHCARSEPQMANIYLHTNYDMNIGHHWFERWPLQQLELYWALLWSVWYEFSGRTPKSSGLPITTNHWSDHTMVLIHNGLEHGRLADWSKCLGQAGCQITRDCLTKFGPAWPT